jgi:hypothetical protein
MLNMREEIMLTMDVPVDMPVQQYPVVLVANESSVPEKSMGQPDFILKYCQPVPSWDREPIPGERGIDPVGRLIIHLKQVEGHDINFYKDRPAFTNLTLLEGPKHGTITTLDVDDFTITGYSTILGNFDPVLNKIVPVDIKGYRKFHYVPILNYQGKDNVAFMVEFEDKRYEIVVDLVVEVAIGSNVEYYCPNGYKSKLIKVRKPISGIWSNPADHPDFANGYRTTSLQTLLSGAKDALAGFADLTGSALGQTTSDKITLDTDAAGHGGFIDYTPYLNEEWLPTSSAVGWVETKWKPSMSR